jgi:Domain of unknown function (DUF4416)
MGKIRNPIPVKLFIGMLSPEPALFDACSELVRGKYGPIDAESAVLPWGDTEYYRDEMGQGIARKFIFFGDLKDAACLSEVKVFTNKIEQDLSERIGERARRRINLDPGYVTEAKVVLATTKDFSHRIYIGEGIYAEVTLRYANAERSFTPLAHTYPDYRTEAYCSLFNAARARLRAALDRK